MPTDGVISVLGYLRYGLRQNLRHRLSNLSRKPVHDRRFSDCEHKSECVLSRRAETPPPSLGDHGYELRNQAQSMYTPTISQEPSNLPDPKQHA